VKVVSIDTGQVKAEEFLDRPLARGAGVIGGSIPTVGAAAMK
jgi:hypothetical protein